MSARYRQFAEVPLSIGAAGNHPVVGPDRAQTYSDLFVANMDGSLSCQAVELAAGDIIYTGTRRARAR